MDRILIIDDNREMRELLSQLFFEWCYANVTAGTVEEARQAVLTEGPFNVVISDFQLPDGNGLQFLAWLRWERQDNARFLLISGSTNFGTYRTSDFSFLAKPFRMEELRRRVEELIGNEPQSR